MVFLPSLSHTKLLAPPTPAHLNVPMRTLFGTVEKMDVPAESLPTWIWNWNFYGAGGGQMRLYAGVI